MQTPFQLSPSTQNIFLPTPLSPDPHPQATLLFLFVCTISMQSASPRPLGQRPVPLFPYAVPSQASPQHSVNWPMGQELISDLEQEGPYVFTDVFSRSQI